MYCYRKVADCISAVDSNSTRPSADPDADPNSDFYLMRIRIRLFHPDADPDLEPSLQIKVQTLEKVCSNRIIFGYSIHFGCHLQTDADPDPDFYLMRIRMRIQVTKMMRIRIHNTGLSL
jgi:hypothetical protein